ncbi:hypothetical protein EOD39_17779 [Acipenser ruthenus]|uniref:Uncharacterized protein n=1 Tax=Acipenser ruthenus TaxID=7906 RepID=A0A444V2M6_ACIRT|nr:hypothetical protein EOD39_17779 [Acipenser ruthenus]
MESAYEAFHSYDFEKDENFKKGVRSLSDVTSRQDEQLLRIKMFYYNRFIQPVDLKGYKQWLSSQPPQSVSQTSQQCTAEELWQACNKLQLKDLSVQDSDSSTGELPLKVQHGNGSYTVAPDSEVGEQDCCLSFAEVFKMIQSGQEIPGVQKPNITVCNRKPTASQMNRKPKPWEKKS